MATSTFFYSGVILVHAIQIGEGRPGQLSWRSKWLSHIALLLSNTYTNVRPRVPIYNRKSLLGLSKIYQQGTDSGDWSIGVWCILVHGCSSPMHALLLAIRTVVLNSLNSDRHIWLWDRNLVFSARGLIRFTVFGSGLRIMKHTDLTVFLCPTNSSSS